MKKTVVTVLKVLAVLAIFAVCTAIDWLRIRLVEKNFFKLLDKYSPDFISWLKKQETKVCKILHIEE